MAINDFGDSPSGGLYSFLEFGSIDLKSGKKEVYDFKLQQTAYDWFMLGRYSQDLLVYSSLIEGLKQKSQISLEPYFKKIHHKEDLHLNFLKFVSMEIEDQPVYTVHQNGLSRQPNVDIPQYPALVALQLDRGVLNIDDRRLRRLQ